MADIQVRTPKTSVLVGRRILVVEDDFLIRLDVETTLQDAGAISIGCCTIDEALKTLREGTVDAAVLDVGIGSDTVFSVARALLDGAIPCLFYTGQADTEPVLREFPNCRVLSKPAQPRTLVKAVEELFAQSSA